MTLHYFKEFNYYTEITGFKQINTTQATNYLKNNRKIGPQNIWIQFFNSNLIATYKHLYFATLNTLNAFKHHTNHSKSIAMETMLYTATQHQIQKAIQTIGLKPDTTNMAVTILTKKPQQINSILADLSDILQTTPCETVLDLTLTKINQIKHAFNITNQMIETITKNKETNTALVDLVIEKMALMATKI